MTMDTIIILTIANEIHAFSTIQKMQEYLRKNSGQLMLSESDIQELTDEKFYDNNIADFSYDVVKIDA